MVEVGQPLHAFDLGKLTGPVSVRRARSGENARDPRPRQADPVDRGPGHRGRPRRDRAGRCDGWAALRDRRRDDRHRAGGGVVRARRDRPYGAPAQAVQRRVAPLRARRRPGARAVRRGACRGAAARAGRWFLRRHDRGRGTVRGPAGLARCRAAATHRRDRGAHRRGGVAAAGGRLPGGRRPHPLGHPAELAARPDRPLRPGRGGAAPRRLRRRSPPPCRARRWVAGSPTSSGSGARSSRAVAAFGCTEVLSFPFVGRGRARRARPAGRRRAPADAAAGQPAVGRGPGMRTTLLPGLLATLAATSVAARATSRCTRPARCSCCATASPSAASPTRRDRRCWHGRPMRTSPA